MQFIMDILDGCDLCGEGHSTEVCPELGLGNVQTEVDQLSTRARLTLPSFVEVVDNGSGLVGVVAKETIPAKTQLGPYEAKRTTHIFDDAGFFTLKLIAKDGTTVCLDTTDENECNWMCLVRAATTGTSKNCIAYQLGNNIFYNTSREITPAEELLVWYAPHFARKLGKPSEPDGESRVLLGHRIEPLTADLLLEAGAHTVLHLTEDLRDEEGLQIDTQDTAVDPQPSTNQPTGEIKKAYYCPRCGNTFDTQTDMVQHLREHILNVDGKPRRGRGRPRKNQARSSACYMRGKSQRTSDSENDMLLSKKTQHTYSRKRKLDSEDDFTNNDGDEDDDFIDIETEDKEYSPEKDVKVPGKREQPRRSTRGKHSKLDDDYVYSFKKKGQKNEQSDYDKAVETNELDTDDDKNDSLKADTKPISTLFPVKRGRGRPRKNNVENQSKSYVIIIHEASSRDGGSIVDADKILSAEQVKESLMALKDIQVSETLHGNETETIVLNTAEGSQFLCTNVDHNLEKNEDIKTADTARNETEGKSVKAETEKKILVEGASDEMDNLINVQVTDNVNQFEPVEDISPTKLSIATEYGELEHVESEKKKDIIEENKLDVSVELLTDGSYQVVTSDVTGDSAETTSVDLNAQSELTETKSVMDREISGHTSITNIYQTEFGKNTPVENESELSSCCDSQALEKNTQEMGVNENTQTEEVMESAQTDSHSVTEVDKDTMMVMFEETKAMFEETKDGKYICVLCDEKFDQQIETVSHFSSHSDETAKCKDCKREFKGLQSLLAHRKLCKQFICDICHQAFKTPQYLYRHMVIHTDVFQCERCQKTFSRKDSLQKHILKCCPDLAEKYNIYYCEVCLRVFSKESGWKRHINKCKSVQCKSCRKVFVSNADMMGHVCKPADSDDGGKYSCGLCSKVFQSMYYLKRHQLMHEDGQGCRKCGKRFSDGAEFECHKVLCITLEMIRKYGSWKCGICSQSFGSTKEFRAHFLEHSHPHKCEACSKRFETLVELDCHNCEENELLSCPICLKTFKHQINLDKHAKENMCMKFQCSACNEMFRSKAHAKEHNCIIEATDDGEAQIIHISDNREVCPTCGKSFSSKSNLTKHMTLHGEKKFQCSYCPKVFHLEVYLREHITCVHYNIFKFQCNVCGRLLKSKTGLIAHNRIFHAKNAEVFPCTKCGKVFKQKGNLRSHMFSHSTERKFRCDVCPRAFKYPDQLSRHKFEHKQLPSSRCVHCEKEFIRPYELKRHLQIYHSGYVYVCGICSSRCGHRHTLVRHYKRKHVEKLNVLSEPGYIDSLLKHVSDIYGQQSVTAEADGSNKVIILGDGTAAVSEQNQPDLSHEAAEALRCLAQGRATTKQFQLLKEKGLVIPKDDNLALPGISVTGGVADEQNPVVPQDSYIFQSQSDSPDTDVNMVTISSDPDAVGTVGLIHDGEGTVTLDEISALPQATENATIGENQIVILQIIEPDSQEQRDVIQFNQVQGGELYNLHQNQDGSIVQLSDGLQGQIIQLTQDGLLQEVLKQNAEFVQQLQMQTESEMKTESIKSDLEPADNTESFAIADSVINQDEDDSIDSDAINADTIVPIQDGDLDIQAPMVYSQDVSCSDDVEGM